MTGFGGLHIAEEGGEDTTQHWSGTARILGPRWARFATLSIGLIGLQVFWSVEMSYGACYACAPRTVVDEARTASPYLLSLGLTKSHMALVFLAGPLSGLIVQPLVGARPHLEYRAVLTA
jgi:solute carrier family 45 protein 1/2/4